MNFGSTTYSTLQKNETQINDCFHTSYVQMLMRRVFGSKVSKIVNRLKTIKKL
jgi:hypothetical protein